MDEVEKRLAEQGLAVQRAEASAAADATRVVGQIDVLEQSAVPSQCIEKENER